MSEAQLDAMERRVCAPLPNDYRCSCRLFTGQTSTNPGYIHRVSKKIVQNFFCHNFVKFPPTVIMFGTLIAERIHLCDVPLFSTSPNSCQRPTLLNVDVPNCYIML